MEHVGSNPGVVVGSAHTEKYNHKIGTQKNAEIRVVDPSLNFYRYGIKWSADQIEWFVNDTKYFTFKNDHTDYKAWPFDNPFHLLLNIAVGGSWGGKVDDTMFPMVMEIDYVRVYQEKD
jgi:beta-glucanase (GH16 family)